MEMGRDQFGNTVVRLKRNGWRGFSIQTNGNLPQTHRLKYPFDGEIRKYIQTYGTHYQRRFIQDAEE